MNATLLAKLHAESQAPSGIAVLVDAPVLRRLLEAREALEMVRDADEDCIKDGLPRLPRMPCARIDAALKEET